ncbi:pilus assembly protein [Cereibacter sphaeroides]|uniref:TadE/TadG family type IV pilus assembly protein n=1 Tax=Cereibacter sphaeroides TaxID=1063 RepID=UPI00227901DC|nr:TadE/TadG family type IV pilus assembly protein [Cereibacter sphaeroides]MCE6950692.1 pilus assembly protein [Cereibacter sphaeroides]
MAIAETLLKSLRAVSRFRSQDSGSVTAEFMIVVPVFVMVLMLLADATTIYMQQSNFWNIARDGARAVSRYALTADEAAAYVRKRTTTPRVQPNVSVVVQDGYVTVTVDADASSLTVFDFITFVSGRRITVTTTDIMEPV